LWGKERMSRRALRNFLVAYYCVSLIALLAVVIVVEKFGPGSTITGCVALLFGLIAGGGYLTYGYFRSKQVVLVAPREPGIKDKTGFVMIGLSCAIMTFISVVVEDGKPLWQAFRADRIVNAGLWAILAGTSMYQFANWMGRRVPRFEDKPNDHNTSTQS
jgi:hypothetical protein